MTAAATQDVFVEFLRRYIHDPVLMVREVFGREPFPDQLEVLEYDGSNPAVLELSLPNMRKLRTCKLYGIDLRSADRLITELSRLPSLESLTLKRCRGVNPEQLKNRPGFYALKTLTADDELEPSEK